MDANTHLCVECWRVVVLAPAAMEESEIINHLRNALKKIINVATSETGMRFVDDIAQIANLAEQGLHLQPLVGDPALCPIKDQSIRRG